MAQRLWTIKSLSGALASCSVGWDQARQSHAVLVIFGETPIVLERFDTVNEAVIRADDIRRGLLERGWKAVEPPDLPA